MPVWHGQVHKAVEVPAQPTWVGGEGEVFRTVSPPGFVAKRPRNQESLMKARVLRRWVPKPAHAALPEDELSETPGGPAVAILLRLIAGVILFVLTYPVARARAGITVTFWHLRRAARNLAIALADVHRSGLIVGDMNLMNVLVAHDDPADPCKLTFIDSDSFQFGATDPATGCYRVFKTGVGVPEHLAPELQGRNLREVDRTAETDRFALAVMVWQLLFDGVHPFAVRSVSGGPIPAVEDCIRDGRSNVTPGWPTEPDHEPVVTRAEFDALPASVGFLFIRAFVDGHADPSKRPTAAEWGAALSSWEQSDPRLPTPAAGPPSNRPAATPATPPSPRPPHAAAWVAGLVGAAACVILALVAIAAGSRKADPKPDAPAKTPAVDRFRDAPALWREAATEGK